MSFVSNLRVLVLGVLVLAANAAEGDGGFFQHPGDYQEHIIYIIKRATAPQPTPATPAAAVTAAPTAAPRGNGVFDRFWNDPNQFYVDSPAGPMPLWGHDLVYDSNGNPVPRYPDPITKRLVEHPDDPEAYREYLAFKAVQARRAMITGERLAPFAAEFGMLDKDVLKVESADHPHSFAVGQTTGIVKESLGTPALSPEQTKKLGFQAKQVPRTPGDPNEIEVVWLWNIDCHFCDAMARDWFYFARDVNQAGYKAVSVSLNSDTAEVAARLKYWGIRWPVNDSLNLSDWTDLQTSLNISATPTVFLLNRRTGAMLREEGIQGEQQLRTLFNRISENADGTWPPANSQQAKAIGSAIAIEQAAKKAAATPAVPAGPPATSTPWVRKGAPAAVPAPTSEPAP